MSNISKCDASDKLRQAERATNLRMMLKMKSASQSKELHTRLGKYSIMAQCVYLGPIWIFLILEISQIIKYAIVSNKVLFNHCKEESYLLSRPMSCFNALMYRYDPGSVGGK